MVNMEEVIMPRKQSTKETRDRIIDAAVEVFLEKGYSKSTLEDIVTCAGMTRGAFYWNFKTKQDLLDEILIRYEKFYREIYTSFTHSSSAYETLRSFLLCDLRKKNAFNPYTQIVLYKVESTNGFSRISESQATLDHDFTKMIQDTIERGQKAGEFRTDVDARLLTISVYMSVLGFDNFNAPHEPNPDGTFFPDEEIVVLVDTILHSLLPDVSNRHQSISSL